MPVIPVVFVGVVVDAAEASNKYRQAVNYLNHFSRSITKL